MVKDKFKYEVGMKLIGHSLSKCVLDIARGIVDINDVLVIKAGTCFYSIKTLEVVLDMYSKGSLFSNGKWHEVEADYCKKIVEQLLFTNRIHQERVNKMFLDQEMDWDELIEVPDWLEKSNKIHQDDADHWELA